MLLVDASFKDKNIIQGMLKLVSFEVYGVENSEIIDKCLNQCDFEFKICENNIEFKLFYNNNILASIYFIFVYIYIRLYYNSKGYSKF